MMVAGEPAVPADKLRINLRVDTWLKTLAKISWSLRATDWKRPNCR